MGAAVLASACGGVVAGDSSDAGHDGSVSDTSVPFDGTPPSSDAAPPTFDAFPTPVCPLFSDPCFTQWANELRRTETCMGHADTCTESGDPSGCGTSTSSSAGADVCSWPDGARTENDRSADGLSLSGYGSNAHGDACYKYSGTVSGSGATIDVTFGDGGHFQEIVAASPSPSTIIRCPDGTTTRAFTNTELADCKVGVTCCSASSPPKCP